MNTEYTKQSNWTPWLLVWALLVAPMALQAEDDILVDESAVEEAAAEAAAVVESIPAKPAAAAPEGEEKTGFLVIVPEKIDVEWYWYYYTDVSQHLVQSAIEKELLRAGYDVIDLSAQEILASRESSITSLLNLDEATSTAGTMNAGYLVIGTATSSQASHNTAYGVAVHRYTADVAVKVIRVSDGKVLVVADASETRGGEARKAAARKSLRESGRVAGRDLVRQLRSKVPPPDPNQ